MSTFGDTLKSERQGRELTLEAVAETLKVDPELLRALERNDFEALPDKPVMMDRLRAYAKCLQVDADMMIADYLREREKRLRRREPAVSELSALPAPGAIRAEAARRPRLSPWLLALVVVAIVTLAAWWLFSQDRPAPTPESSVATAPAEPQPPPREPTAIASTPVEPPAAIEPQPPPETPAAVAPTPAEPPPSTQPDTPSPTPLSLAIPEYGVGTAVENLQLVGQSDRFSEGTRVAFWTRTQGGASGQRIEHVWLRQGVEASRVHLEIGGPAWRTHSTKRLSAGAAGDWAVEARDEEGRVLARSEFVCVP